MHTEGMIKQNSDKGFSLVELIIVVSILAIAAIPLMRSMSMASRTNAKAQSIQNATSLAESIMEEMKSTPIDTLKSTYGTDFSASGVMTIEMKGAGNKGITATQGEKFFATVVIRTDTYATPVPGGSTSKADKVKAANVLKLPLIEDIDTNTQAVLTSSREFNRFDSDALNYFNQKIDNYPTRKAEITSKTININKTSSIVAGYDAITVKASVSYEGKITGGTAFSESYVKELYTGTFTPELKEGSTTEHLPLDSNIYIFYQKGPTIPAGVTESIVVDDASTYSVVGSPTDSHRIYFVRQKPADVKGPAISIKRSGNTYLFKYTKPAGDMTTLDINDLVDGNKTFDISETNKVEFITNLGDTVSGTGHIYKQESRTRVYDITVVLTKPDDASGTKYAELNSTITVDGKS